MTQGAAPERAGERAVAVTVDVETDWGGRLRPGPGSVQGIERGLPRMLAILDEAGVPATFFICAEVIPYVRDVLRDAVAQGHEIASHSLQHRNLAIVSRDELREEVARSKLVLEDEFGVAVRGFRAPQGRVHPGLFALLSVSGYVYDSSRIGTFFPGRYRYRGVAAPHVLSEGIVEIPVPVLPRLGVPMGLLWLNLLAPRARGWLMRQPSLPDLVILYSHPFDVLEQKEPSSANWPLRLWYMARARQALQTFADFVHSWLSHGGRFVTLGQVAAALVGYGQAGSRC